MENFDFIAWIFIPLLIFIARLVDVSLATIRHILIFRGQKKIVPAIAFVEVTIWLLAITQVMENLSNAACFLAWAFGFAAGTYLGMIIEERLALGYQLIRVITQGNADSLSERLSNEGFRVTAIGANGSRGSVGILLVISERKNLGRLTSLLGSLKPRPFFTIEDVRSVGSTIVSHAPIPGDLSADGGVKRK